MGLKQRKDIRNDPDYYYMVGQLVGVTIMLSTHMELYGDEKAKGMSDQAKGVIGYFRTNPPLDNLGGWVPEQ